MSKSKWPKAVKQPDISPQGDKVSILSIQVCSGLWAAGVLKGAVELQVFDHLAPGPQAVDRLSQTLGAPPQSLQILLDALVALGFLDKVSQGYRLTPVSAEFLTAKPTYLGGFAAEMLMNPVLFDLYTRFSSFFKLSPQACFA